MACSAVQGDFYSSSLVTLPLGLSSDFSLITACGPFAGLPQGGKGMEDCLDHGGPGGNRCMGKPEAMGIIDLALAPGGKHENVNPVGDFS